MARYAERSILGIVMWERAAEIWLMSKGVSAVFALIFGAKGLIRLYLGATKFWGGVPAIVLAALSRTGGPGRVDWLQRRPARAGCVWAFSQIACPQQLTPPHGGLRALTVGLPERVPPQTVLSLWVNDSWSSGGSDCGGRESG